MRRLYGVGCAWVSVAALLSGCAQEAPAPGALTTMTAALGGIDEGLSLEDDAEEPNPGESDANGGYDASDPSGGSSVDGPYADAEDDLSGVIDGSVTPEDADTFEDSTEPMGGDDTGVGPGPDPFVDVMTVDVYVGPNDPDGPGEDDASGGGPVVDVMTVDVFVDPVEPDVEGDTDDGGVSPQPDIGIDEEDVDPWGDVDTEPDTDDPEPDTDDPEPDADGPGSDTDEPGPDTDEGDLCDGVDCDDDDSCTEDVCDPETGLCVHTFIDVPECNPCTLAPTPTKADWSIPGIKVGVDIPGSGMWCKLLYLPGELQASVTISGEGESTLDSSCKGHYAAGTQIAQELELCGPLLGGAQSLAGELDLQHCKVCNTPPQFECEGYDCLDAKLTGSVHPQVGVNLVAEFGDTSFIGGVKCNLQGVQGMKTTGTLEATIPGDEPCTDEVCHECYKASIDVQPTQSLSAGCGGTIGGISVGGGGSVTLQGSLKNTLRVGHPSCASPPVCLTGGIDANLDLALNIGIGAGLTGSITFAKYSCDWTWDKGTCADEEDTKPFSCEWKFFDLWFW